MGNTHSLLGILVIEFIYLQLSVSAQGLPSSVVINEYLSDPIGIDTGLEWIELFNPTCGVIDITGYELTASSGNFYVMPNFVLLPRSYVVIHWRKDGVDTSTDLHTSTTTISSNMGNTSGYIALFNSTTHGKSTIVDYLEYGVGTQSWEQTASDAGIWQNGDYLAISGEGKTNGRINDGVDTNTSSDFMIYDEPTVGSENSPLINPCVIDSPTPTEIIPTQSPIPQLTVGPTQAVTIAPTNTPSPVLSPTQTVTPTSNLSPTITPILTISPTVTSIPTIKPTVTPTPFPQIDYNLPTESKINENISIKVTITNAKPQTEYAIKFEAGINNTWTYGKTIENDGNLLAWNANWKLFPTVITNNVGEAEQLITVQIINIPGAIDTRIKLADLVNSKYYYSSIKTINVSSIIPLETPVPTIGLTFTPTPTNISPEIESKAIKEVKLFSEKTIVKVQGWVSVDQNLLGNESFYIQDESAGIKVALSDTVNVNIAKGDLLTIIGELGFAYSEAVIHIKNASNINVEKANHVFNLQKVVTGNVGEQTEGNLIGIIGKVVETSGSTFFVDDGSGRVKVYIKDTTQIDKPYMRQGYYVNVIGIVSQYKKEYRVLPRYNSDLYVSKLPISNQVLGAIDELPNTGSWDLVIYLIFVVIGVIGLRISFLSQRFMLRNNKCVVQ